MPKENEIIKNTQDSRKHLLEPIKSEGSQIMPRGTKEVTHYAKHSRSINVKPKQIKRQIHPSPNLLLMGE